MSLQDLVANGARIRVAFGKPEHDCVAFTRRVLGSEEGRTALADSLTAHGVEPDDAAGSTEQLVDEALMENHRFAQWAEQGFNTFNLTDSLCAALLLTEPRDLEPDDVRLPFLTFALTIPDQFVIVDWNGTGTSCRHVWIHSYVSIGGEQRLRIDAVPTAGASLFTQGSVANFLTEAGTRGLDPQLKQDPVATEHDVTNIQLAVRLALNFVLWLHMTGGVGALRPQGRPKKRANYQRGTSWPTVWFVGREVKLSRELRDAAKEQAQVAAGAPRASWSLRSRHIVRGHMKMQAHGPKHLERKTIWIEPYWRGPEGGAAWVHAYSASEKNV